MIERLWERGVAWATSLDPRTLRWLVLIGMMIRIALWLAAEGSNDIRIWERFSGEINTDGVLATYTKDPMFNHPPLMALWALAAAKIGEALTIPFAIVFKVPMLLADVAAAFTMQRAIRRRGGSENAAWGAAAIFALCPVSIWITAFHGNTDSLCAYLAFLAVMLVDDSERPFLAGFVFALSLNVKLIPLVFGPALLLCQAKSLRQALLFCLGGAIGVTPFLAPILKVGEAFYTNAIAYNSHPNQWGLHFFFFQGFRVQAVTEELTAIDLLWAKVARYVILAASAGAGIWARVTKQRAADACAVVIATFFLLTPGVGVQYFVFPVLLFIFIDRARGLFYSLVGGLFVGGLYVHFMTGWLPMSSKHDHQFPMPAAMVGVVVWIALLELVWSRIRPLAALQRRVPALDPARITLSPRIARALVLVLIAAGALRVAYFALVFPLFAPPFEASHADTLTTIRRGTGRALLPPFTQRIISIGMRDAAPEYTAGPSKRKIIDGQPPRYHAKLSKRDLMAATKAWQKRFNDEEQQPPVYYTLAHRWWGAARQLGFRPVHALFVTRLFNVVAVVLLLLAAWRVARRMFQERPHLVVATVALLVLMPQDAFYTLNNNALAAAMCALALWLAHPMIAGERASPIRYAAAGLALSFSLLTKLSTAPIVVVVVVVLLFRFVATLWQSRRRGDAPNDGVPVSILGAMNSTIVFLACTFFPFAVWCTRNVRLNMDALAFGPRLVALGWISSAPSSWKTHPLLTFDGLTDFLGAVCTTFWRGDLMWGSNPMRVPVADAIYVSTTLLALLSAAALAVSGLALLPPARRMLVACGLSVLASVLLLAAMSAVFDLKNATWPVQPMPFVAAGPLISGALLPFAIVFVAGADALTTRAKPRLLVVCLLLVLGFVAFSSELGISLDVIDNRYNWSHLPNHE